MAPESLFKYNVSRSYPFRWFTPVAILGGLVLTVLFSVLNFALNGFELVPYVYDQPPDQPAAWYQRFSVLQGNSLQANCSVANFPLNSQFFTNQSGLTYTLSAIWTRGENGTVEYAPTLSYDNEVLQNCSVFLVQVEIEELDRTANQVNTAAWGAIVRAFSTCSIQDKTGAITYLNLTAPYETIQQSYTALIGPQVFVATNQYKRASLWWGESLLSAWWANVSASLMYTLLVNEQNDLGAPFRKGLIQWVHDENVTDITEPGFGMLTYDMVLETGDDGQFENAYVGDVRDPFPMLETIAYAGGNITNGSVIVHGADRLARSMYSAVKVDLGQFHEPAASNILLDESALQSFTETVAFTGFPWVNFIPGPATGDYNSLKDTTGPLGTTPAVISTKYTCQIPTRKAAGPLVMSILVADLVFLQLAWKVYLFVAGLFLREKDRPDYCAGCMKHFVLSEGISMDRMETPLIAKGSSAKGRYNRLADGWFHTRS